MKVVVIGGGVAGITAGALLYRQQHNVVVCERAAGIPARGNAFLMHNDGIGILNELKKIDRKIYMPLPGKTINKFVLKRPSGKELMNMKIAPWQCIKRSEFINFLYSLVPYDIVKEGRVFDGFLYENGRAVAAVFQNGDIEYGDVFIGADGSNSLVRNSIFGSTDFTPVEVKEVVGVARNSRIVDEYKDTFTKFQSNVKGIAFGFIPTSDDEVVWFMQYDPAIGDITEKSPEALKAFCLNMTRRFPDVVREVIESDDFSNTYVWFTRDFDLLPTFHKENVVLIGDAAHLALPFTSAGTTNAIRDAKVLLEAMAECDTLDEAFGKYYLSRITDLSAQLSMGRKHKANFLDPMQVSEEDISVPLIYQSGPVPGKPKEKVRMLYFSDPICSTCWTIQPQLRRLQLEYGDCLDIKYHMGGLLPSWESYSSGAITEPVDAAYYWEEAADIYDIPMQGDVWLQDPLRSSFPPSVAFKAAQNQGAELAISFLRRVREMLFLENKNIARWEVMREAAFDVGLDVARLRRDYEGNGVVLFKEDLELARQYDVTSFPTIFFVSGDKVVRVKEYRAYEAYEQIIRQFIPGAERRKYEKEPMVLFEAYNTMSTKEFAYFMDISTHEAVDLLNDLYLRGQIDKYVSRNGSLWKTNMEI